MKRRSHALFALALASALGAVAGSSFAGAPLLYKCIDGGRTVYQQQACPVTMVADAPASAVNTNSAPAPTATHKVKSAAPAASTAPATPR